MSSPNDANNSSASVSSTTINNDNKQTTTSTSMRVSSDDLSAIISTPVTASVVAATSSSLSSSSSSTTSTTISDSASSTAAAERAAKKAVKALLHNKNAKDTKSSVNDTSSLASSSTPSLLVSETKAAPVAVDRGLLDTLMQFGYSSNAATRALYYTKNSSIDSAMNWIVDHIDDADIELPLTLPSSPLTAPSSSSSSSSTSPAKAASSSTSATVASAAAVAPSGMADILSSMMAAQFQPYKMILVVRSDLKMKTGKIGAQCAHAAVGMVMHLQTTNPGQLAPWLEQGQAKVVVRVDSLEQMQTVAANARAANIPTFVVRDAGRTQVEAGSQTVLCVGPAAISLVDSVTKHLKLL